MKERSVSVRREYTRNRVTTTHCQENTIKHDDIQPAIPVD